MSVGEQRQCSDPMPRFSVCPRRARACALSRLGDCRSGPCRGGASGSHAAKTERLHPHHHASTRFHPIGWLVAWEVETGVKSGMWESKVRRGPQTEPWAEP